MRAAICRQFGEPESLRIEEVPAPRPGPRELRVAVKAAGLNFPDVLTIRNQYQHKAEPPFVPGQELAGVVVETGREVTEFRPGDRVVSRCRLGAFAEEALCQADGRTIRLPEGVDFPTGAAFATTYGTSYHALRRRAGLQPGETVLVLGAAGGVGLAAVELAAVMGARVIAAASTAEKLEACRRAGAAETINYSTEPLRERIRELTAGRGVDVVVDPVGGDQAEPALRGMAWGGRYLVVGFAAGAIPRFPLNLVLLKGCSVIGVAAGTAASHDKAGAIEEMETMARWIAEGRLKPLISASYPLEEVGRALRRIADRAVTGKVVVVSA